MIQCDETRPTCLRCQRRGIACPGFSVDSLFRDEGAKLQSRYASTASDAVSCSIAYEIFAESNEDEDLDSLTLLSPRTSPAPQRRSPAQLEWISVIAPLLREVSASPLWQEQLFSMCVFQIAGPAVSFRGTVRYM